MNTNIIQYLNNTVKLVPNKKAYCLGEQYITFDDVYLNSRAIASYICSNNIYKEPVVVFMGRYPTSIVSYLGVITAGCFYVPLDLEMSSDRIQLILENTKAKMIICDNETYHEALSITTCQTLVKYEDLIQTPINDDRLETIQNQSIDTDPIYIVYTSGSTGIPKGVIGTHRATIDYIENLSNILKLSSDSVFGNQTPLYLDACFKEVFTSIKFGATTYIVPKEYFTQPVRLVEYLNEYQVNTICWVVSALKIISVFNTFKTIIPTHLHTIAFGSEVFPPKELRKWREALPLATFYNLYGPTECTGMSCYYKVEKDFLDDEVIPIGKPFNNTDVFLLDENNQFSNEGEICIRGTSLTLGYFNDSERTDAVFVRNPLNPYYHELIYRTGDIGRFDDEGNLYFISRKDFQIKHLGHRIELGEIESIVRTIDSIEEVACIYDQKKIRILLFYAGDVELNDVKSFIKEKLPKHMQPNKVRQLDVVPLTSNGKVDRVSLSKEYIK